MTSFFLLPTTIETGKDVDDERQEEERREERGKLSVVFFVGFIDVFLVRRQSSFSAGEKTRDVP